MRVKIDTDLTPDCWPHSGYRAANGYGHTPRGTAAHRAAWEVLHGPLPPGLELDHLCRNRACTRPSHLVPLSRSDNDFRRSAFRRRQLITSGKWRCWPGEHNISGDNSIPTPQGGAVCALCNRGDQ